jgi:L-2-hydroxyglutarate oxidase LhgO
MLALRGDAEGAGAMLALGAKVSGGRVLDDGRTSLEVAGSSPMLVVARQIVNSAGLGAQDIARAIDGLAPAAVPALYLAKGNYFSLSHKAPFRHLFYPRAGPGGLASISPWIWRARARFARTSNG